MKDFKFKKGDYVVLLKACNGHNCWRDSMPINYCYRLRKESTNYMFYPELDIKGDDSNGWWFPDSRVNDLLYVENKQMEVRYATSDEIAMYEKLQKPFNINIIKQKSENLDYLIDILKQHNIT